jgi:hypothetical protein
MKELTEIIDTTKKQFGGKKELRRNSSRIRKNLNENYEKIKNEIIMKIYS